MRSMLRAMLAQAAGGGGGGGGAATIVQSQYLRVDGNGTVSLSSTPTVGNVMLLLMAGFGTNAGNLGGAEPPAGWTQLVYGRDGSGVPLAQKAWAAYKTVVGGDTGSVSWSPTTDITNMAIFEITPFTNSSAAVGTATTGSGTWSVPFSLPAFTPTLRFVFYEHDTGASIPAIDGGQGITNIHVFDTPSYVNHFAVLGQVPNGFNGTVTGTSTGGQSFPAYLTLSLG